MVIKIITVVCFFVALTLASLAVVKANTVSSQQHNLHRSALINYNAN